MIPKHPNNLPTVRLFIGGLPYRYTEGELLSLFAPFGRIISLKIMHNQWGKSRGMGYVEFDNIDSATQAKKELHNFRVDESRTIIVDYAKPDPFKTPEGQQRHQRAIEAKEKRFARFHKNAQSAPTNKFKKTKPTFGTVRQSIYDQRTHHSRVGSKFATKTRQLNKHK